MKIAIFFSRHAEALLNKNSKRTYGGGEIQMYNIAKEFGKRKSVNAFTLIQDYDEINFDEEDKFNLVRTFREGDNVFSKFYKTIKVLKKTNPDVLIQRGVTPHSYFLAKYCKFKKIKFVLMFGFDNEAKGYYQTSGKKCRTFKGLINNSNKVVVQNEIQKNDLKYNQDSVYILKKGLDFSKLPKTKKKEYDAIWIGKSQSVKRAEIFLKLVKQNPSLKFLLILTKAEEQKNLFHSIKKEAQSLKNLDYLENVDNKTVYDSLSKSKVLAFTSEKEGDWPMVVLEATAMGLPVLAYNLNYDYLINDYGGGIFCKKEFNVLDDCFKDLMENEKKYLEMSKNAKRYAKEHHDLENMVDNFLEIIKG